MDQAPSPRNEAKGAVATHRPTDDARYFGLFPRFQAVGQAFAACRVSLALVVVGVLALLVPDQTAEALTALCERGEALVTGMFVAAAMSWGFSTWYFARQMLRFAYPNRTPLPARVHPTYRFTARWLPRVLGVAAPLCTAGALLRCLGRTRAVVAPALWLVVLSAVFFWFVVARRNWLERSPKRRVNAALSDRLGRLHESLRDQLEELYEPTIARLANLPRITQILLLGHVAAFFVLATVFVAFPVPVAPVLGAPTVVLLALSSWVVAGSAIAYLASWLRLPLTLLLVTWAVFVSPRTDDHVAVPVTRDREPPPVRKAIAEDFRDWQRATGASKGDPYFVVATEGGGVRAAYWTAALLTALEERHPGFSSRLYAVSSVSGGSLGAAVYLTLLAGPPKSGSMRALAGAILRDDALAPPLAKLLYPELFQRIWPWPIAACDRGMALEGAWARSIRQRTTGGVFEGPFDGIWAENAALPRLFMNATLVETGQRVVFSFPTPPENDQILDGQSDGDYTLAQEVHDSARFPYVSPAATFVGALAGHVVDGGYFENSGAATASDVIDAIGDQGDARVLVIRYADEDRDGRPLRWATELVAPPAALYKARDARGHLARATLEDQQRGEFVELALPSRPQDPPYPLGWMLSAGAAARMDRAVDQVLDGAEEKIAAWLKPATRRAGGAAPGR